MTELITPRDAPLADLRATTTEAEAYHAQARAESILHAYRSDWRAFEQWCSVRQFTPLPAAPETVALYITCAVCAGEEPQELDDLVETYQELRTRLDQADKNDWLAPWRRALDN